MTRAATQKRARGSLRPAAALFQKKLSLPSRNPVKPAGAKSCCGRAKPIPAAGQRDRIHRHVRYGTDQANTDACPRLWAHGRRYDRAGTQQL